jgi:hypothetical protein
MRTMDPKPKFKLHWPHLTGYQVISILLLTLVGLFLGVVTFASFGVLNYTQEPIALLKTAIDNQKDYMEKIDTALLKINLLQNHQAEQDIKEEAWKSLMVNDHLFLSGMTALKKAEIDMIAKRLGIDISSLPVNGSSLVLGQNLSVPIPPSALEEFQRETRTNNNETGKVNLQIPITPSLLNNFS